VRPQLAGTFRFVSLHMVVRRRPGRWLRWRRLAALLVMALALCATATDGSAAIYLWVSQCAPNPTGGNLPPDGSCVGGAGLSPTQPTYAIHPSATFLTVQQGLSTTSTLTVVPWNGFQGQVTMAVALYPSSPVGTSEPAATFSNGTPETQSSPNGSGQYAGQVLTFAVPIGTKLGEYQYTVQAESPLANPPYVSGSLWLRVIGAGAGSGPNDGGSCPDPNCNFTSGGTVMSSPQVFVILWGSLYASDTLDAMPAALKATAQDLPGSQYAGRLAQYGVGGLSYGGGYVDTQNDGALNDPLSANDLINEINRVNSITGWGSGSGNHIYVVEPEAGYSIQNTAGTGTHVCAFHDWNSNPSYAYVALPNFDNGNYFSDCVTGETASPQNSDEEVMTHEIVEAATDPQFGSGWTVGNQEIADVCNWDSTLVSGVRYATGSEFYDKGAGQCTGQQEGGYWLTSSSGCITSVNHASWHGDECGTALNQPISGVAAHPSGQGYWLVGQDGGVFAKGSAQYEGSLPGQHTSPVAPIVGIASTPDGGGYWLVGADGGVFAFGNAPFLGSMGGKQLNAPVAGITSTPDGQGYWLVGQDGGVFSFGDALFFGNALGQTYGSCSGATSEAWIGISSSPDGDGYWLFSNIGDIVPASAQGASGNPAPFFGSAVCDSSAPMTGAAFNFDRWGTLALDANGSTYAVGDISGPSSGATGGRFVGIAFVR
jgi:hypothetical protein